MNPNNAQKIRFRHLIDEIDSLMVSETNFISIGKLVRYEIDYATKKDEYDYLKDLEIVLQKAAYYYHQKENKQANYNNFANEFIISVKSQLKRISHSHY